MTSPTSPFSIRCKDCFFKKITKNMGDYGNLIFTVECKKSLKVVHTVIIHSAVYLRYHPDAPKVRVITRANLDKCPDYRHKQITLDRF